MDQPVIEERRTADIILKKHQLPPLKYGYEALEPCIDSRTMMLHHDIHHGAYVEKLNTALEGGSDPPKLFGFVAAAQSG